MARLPSFQSPDRVFQMLQSQWSSLINPVLSNPASNPRILKNISLINGTNVINHGLGRTQQGWMISDIDGAAQIYRSEPFNDLTLTLVSDAAVMVNLIVY